MSRMLPPLVTEAAALSVAGVPVRRYEMGPALIGVGPEATVVVVASGDDPGGSGVQDSTQVLLLGDRIPELHSRFDFDDSPAIHVFARLEQGHLPLGTARCRGRSSAAVHFDHARLELERPMSRVMLDAVRPVPVPGPVPGVDWVDQVEGDPVGALESFVLGWFPAEEAGPVGEPGDLPEALASFHRLARLRPAIHRFHDPVLKRPERAGGSLGDRLVFAAWNGGSMDWSFPWPPEGEGAAADPLVWHTEDPGGGAPETIVEREPLSRFLLQFTLFGALLAAPFKAATLCMPVANLGGLWSVLRPVPLSPFLPTYNADRFFVAPGLLAMISVDEDEAIACFGALHRGTLSPLLAHGFRWSRFDG
ncbi:hypothetical protein ACFVRB_34480 [Streptomyces nojiriensis]|uniref:hypothetical protein n=1 Tax=Streptomyces nojiriensis TaxID=66374 RepID=UPI0036D903A7